MIPEQAKNEIRSGHGGSRSGEGAPNGSNPVGAMNTIERLAQDIEDNGYADHTLLDNDRQVEYEEAWADLQYWTKLFANVWSTDVAGNDGGMEVNVSTTDTNGNEITETRTVSNPHGATTVGSGNTDFPERPV